MTDKKRKRCGAKTVKGGKCQKWGMPNGRCRKHGGATPTGPVLPQFKHGLYSKSIPTRLAGRYEEALSDGQLIELRREAAVLTAIVDETLSKLDTGETGALWFGLREGWADYQAASGGERALKLALVGRMIEAGAREAETVRELRAVILDKVRVAESERRRLVEASQMITSEQLVALAAALAAVVVAEVSDRAARTRILDGFDRALSRSAR